MPFGFGSPMASFRRITARGPRELGMYDLCVWCVSGRYVYICRRTLAG